MSVLGADDFYLLWANQVLKAPYPSFAEISRSWREAFYDMERHNRNAIEITKAEAHRVWAERVTQLERSNRALNERNVELERKALR